MRNLYSTITLLLATGLLSGCSGNKNEDTGASDLDGDGLTAAEEAELGTDPTEADSDGDGLDDGVEVDDHGTDPLVDDTDGDGYLDGEEVDGGTNPSYEYSHLYAGDYNVGYCADGVATATGPTGAGVYNYGGSSYNWDYYQPGDVMENFSLLDQYGEYVDLYSFCGQHVTITNGAFW